MPTRPGPATLPANLTLLHSTSPSHPLDLGAMTLVTRSAIRLSRRGGQTLRSARANAAFFNTAASQAQNVLPKFTAQSSKINVAAKPSELLWTR